MGAEADGRIAVLVLSAAARGRGTTLLRARARDGAPRPPAGPSGEAARGPRRPRVRRSPLRLAGRPRGPSPARGGSRRLGSLRASGSLATPIVTIPISADSERACSPSPRPRRALSPGLPRWRVRGSASAGLSGREARSPSAQGIGWPIRDSIAASDVRRPGSTSVKACPTRPARPVRPMRWT